MLFIIPLVQPVRAAQEDAGGWPDMQDRCGIIHMGITHNTLLYTASTARKQRTEPPARALSGLVLRGLRGVILELRHIVI